MKLRETCYKIFYNMKTFYQAGAACRGSAQGGTLAMPRDSETNDFLRAKLNGVYRYFWFGLTYLHREGRSIWIDGTPLSPDKFNAYDLGKPDNQGDCVAYCTSTKIPMWGNGPCLWRAPYICQIIPGQG
ncbi:PREDICTED: C-type lectin domain family 3 member A homolog [Branchiostoma belcheri]|uniref:C-type lectin domain family 3 member A homolog n=1 Tax=Branchiostoma belcheri TaxID=7741 RepID=A0A6P5A1K7_BRABE|nr:PREDICTED: C-type lectin domain family 3 member A homolog [Branchiostoma belcheri]